MKIRKGLLNLAMGIVVPLAVGTGIYFSPDKIISIDKDTGIYLVQNGSLKYKNLVDANANGIANYGRIGFVSRPNGGEIRFEVPENKQKEYFALYQKSKFSKEKK